MINNHPITRPSKELMQQWRHDACGPDYETDIATQAARWGADRQLEMCKEWLEDHVSDLIIDMLHDAMRPKPPSLAEQALQELERTVMLLMPVTGSNKVKRFAAIRRALERLQELEGAQ